MYGWATGSRQCMARAQPFGNRKMYSGGMRLLSLQVRVRPKAYLLIGKPAEAFGAIEKGFEKGWLEDIRRFTIMYLR